METSEKVFNVLFKVLVVVYVCVLVIGYLWDIHLTNKSLAKCADQFGGEPEDYTIIFPWYSGFDPSYFYCDNLKTNKTHTVGDREKEAKR